MTTLATTVLEQGHFSDLASIFVSYLRLHVPNAVHFIKKTIKKRGKDLQSSTLESLLRACENVFELKDFQRQAILTYL